MGLIKFLLLIIVLYFIINTFSPDFFNNLKEKTNELLENEGNVTIEINETALVSVGRLNKECSSNEECNNYNTQCDGACICKNGECYKNP